MTILKGDRFLTERACDPQLIQISQKVIAFDRIRDRFFNYLRMRSALPQRKRSLLTERAIAFPIRPMTGSNSATPKGDHFLTDQACDRN